MSAPERRTLRGRLVARVDSEQSLRGYSRLLSLLRVVGRSAYRRLYYFVLGAWRRLETISPVQRARLRVRAARAERAPSSGSLWTALGDLQLALGDVGAALVAWRRGIEHAPDTYELYDRVGYEMWQRGNWDEAHAAWAREAELRRERARRHQLDRVPLLVLDRMWSDVIGALALLDPFVKQQLLDGRPLDRILLLARPKSAANPCYLDYWRRHLPSMVFDEVGYARLAPLAELRRVSIWTWEDAGGEFRSLYDVGAEVERRWEAENRPPLLELKPEHRDRGREQLSRLGVPDDAWFVALHVREDGYHDVRNASIESYRQAAEAVAERGGWIVRMGDAGMAPMPDFPNAVDYARSEAKSDWMDVFVWAACRFLIGTQSGPVAIPSTFGVPVVQTNWCPMGARYWVSRDLQVPKLYWSEREQRHLSFAESIRPPVGFAHLPETLTALGIRAVDNTPVELAEVVVEMLDRLDGTAVYTAEDDELQRRFDQLEPPLRYRIPTGGARRGRDFLRRHAHLLEEPGGRSDEAER